jgi:nucleotide-binding universal stress UspA family protein
VSGLVCNRVVVPIDLEDPSLAALETALTIAASPSGIHVVHVVPHLAPTESLVAWETLEAGNRAARARELIRRQLQIDEHERFRGVHIEIEFGDPGTRIAEVARRVKAELIIIPSRGRKGLSRVLLGSVADRVARLAPCPVLILRRKEAAPPS